MKKRFPILAAVLLVVLSVAGLAEAGNKTKHPPKTDVEVAAMFAAADIQPFTEADGNKEMLDSIWIALQTAPLNSSRTWTTACACSAPEPMNC